MKRRDDVTLWCGPIPARGRAKEELFGLIEKIQQRNNDVDEEQLLRDLEACERP
jgi:hypothetical protein